MEDQREFTRVTPHLGVTLVYGETTIAGHTKDICMKGLYAACSPQLPAGTECAVTIHLGGPESGVQIGATGKVVRADTTGMAMLFTEIDDLESYEHLTNLILYNAQLSENVERELAGHVGIKRPDSI